MYTLVLGGNSYIAQSLRMSLHEQSIPTMIFCRKPPKQKYNNEYLVLGEINNHEKLNSCFNKKISTVFQFIYSGNPRSSSNPELFNFLKYLLSLVVKNNVRNYIFPSSGSVYGNNKTINNETTKLSPISKYAKDKSKEELITCNTLNNSKTNAIILRIGNVYGPNYSKLSTQGIIPTILYNIYHNKPIDVWGDGTVIRDYIFIDDLVDILMTLRNYNKSTLLNIGSGEAYSVNDLINVCFGLTNKIVPINYSNGYKEDVIVNTLDVNKAKKLLAWSPKYNIKNGILKCWNKTKFS